VELKSDKRGRTSDYLNKNAKEYRGKSDVGLDIYIERNVNSPRFLGGLREFFGCQAKVTWYVIKDKEIVRKTIINL